MRAKLETAAGNPENQDRGLVVEASIGLIMVPDDVTVIFASAD